MIYQYITGGRRNSSLNTLIISRFITISLREEEIKYISIIYHDIIMIYHYITGGRRNSYLIKHSDNIMIHYAYMIKTLCGISKNKSLIKPVINHHIINIAYKKHIRYFLIYHK